MDVAKATFPHARRITVAGSSAGGVGVAGFAPFLVRFKYGNFINLTVFNVAGQAVRTLASGARDAGRYTVPWDGRDSAGQRVAAGVYFYRLTAGDNTLTKKMTVMQ